VVPEPGRVLVAEEVREALARGRAVVALESTIVVHGLPAPDNLEVAAECEAAIRAAGAVPATVGVVEGRAVLGLCADELARLADPVRRAAKLSARDLGPAFALRASGATTVAGTIAVAHAAGVLVMATGGLGGVHRGAAASYDESADLTALSRYPVLVVASGVKSVLDVAATLERLDSLGVPVLGYRTDDFPGFYLARTGHHLDWTVESARAAALALRAHRATSPTGVLLARPVDAARQLDPALHERALAAALAAASRVSGRDVTPVMLAEFAAVTGGASVAVNRELVVDNAALAGQVAIALADVGS
jgi:pseudouridylate synthase